MASLPQFNATGTWVLKSPFDVPSDKVYTLEGLTEFRVFESRGVDVYNTYYAPFGISQEQYDSDLENSVEILTIVGTDESEVVFPSSFLIKYPDALVVPYSRVTIAADIGLLPDEVPLIEIANELAVAGKRLIGSNVDVKVMRYPVSDEINVATHQQLEANRTAAIEDSESNHGELVRLRDQVQQYTDKNAALETIIKDQVTVIADLRAQLAGN